MNGKLIVFNFCLIVAVSLAASLPGDSDKSWIIGNDVPGAKLISEELLKKNKFSRNALEYSYKKEGMLFTKIAVSVYIAESVQLVKGGLNQNFMVLRITPKPQSPVVVKIQIWAVRRPRPTRRPNFTTTQAPTTITEASTTSELPTTTTEASTIAESPSTEASTLAQSTAEETTITETPSTIGDPSPTDATVSESPSTIGDPSPTDATVSGSPSEASPTDATVSETPSTVVSTTSETTTAITSTTRKPKCSSESSEEN